MPPDNTPPADPPPGDGLDPTMSLLFESVASEATPPEPPARSRSIHEAMAQTDADPPAGDPPPADPPAGDPPAGDAPPDPPVKVKRKVPPAPKLDDTPTPPATPPAPPPEEIDESDLIDEEREQLEIARTAERMDPKYKGLAARQAKFFKDHAAYLAAAKKADPHASFDEDNEDYQDWLRENAVKLSPREREAARVWQVREEVRRESDDKLNEVRDEVYRTHEEPKVRGEVDEFFRGLVGEALGDEIKELVKKEGSDKFREVYPVEHKIASAIFHEASSDIEAFTKLTRINPATKRPMMPFDEKNPQHSRVLQFIELTCNEYEKEAKGLMKDGKRFVTRDTMARIKPEERGKYWTFTNKEIVSRARETAAAAYKQAVAAHYDELKRGGWERKPRGAKPAEPPAPGTKPPSAPRPAPIPDPGTPPAEGVSRHMKVLLGE